MKPWMYWSAAIVLIALVAFGIERGLRTAPSVEVGKASEREIKASFTAEGVTKGKDYALSSRAIGVIRWLGVKEGDEVRKGRRLMMLDTAHAEATIRQSEAAVQTARAGAHEARAAYNLARGQIEASIAAASARIAQAKAHLARVRQGAKKEEIDVAQHRLKQAQAALEKAQRDYERTDALYKQGAVSRSDFDAAELAYRSSKSDVDAQKSVIALLEAGATHQEIEEAQTAVESAKADYETALKGRNELKVRRSAIAGALSRESEASGALSVAKSVLADYELSAPADGVIVRLYSESGTMAGPSVVSMILMTRQNMRIEAEIGSEDAAKVKVGMPLTVTSGAWPGRQFPAHLTRLSGAGEIKPDAAIRTRILRAEVSLDDGFSLFKPGLDVDVEGTNVLRRTLVVPSDALGVEGAQTWVWLVKDGRVKKRLVVPGFSDVDWTEIVSGLESGDLVVVRGREGLADGEAVKVRR